MHSYAVPRVPADPTRPDPKHVQRSTFLPMPAPRALTRLVDDRHPVAGWLFRALAGGGIVLRFADNADAKRAASAFAGFRRKGRIGPPGSFEQTVRDPNGEGIGYFDRVVIQQRGTEVHLRHLPEGHASLRANAINPVSVRELDPEDVDQPASCSHVNPEGFDVVTG